MIQRAGQFWALASLTAVETIRQPLCLLLTTSCVLLMGLIPLLLLHQFGEDGRMVRDAAMAVHFVFGLFVAGHAACSSLAGEMRKGTASAALSKPVSREIFFLAKFAGIAAVVLAFSACAAFSTLLSERVAEKFSEARTEYITDTQTSALLIAAPFAAYLIAGLINYFARRPFESTAFGLLFAAILAALFAACFFNTSGEFAPFDARVQWRLLPASLLITMALVTLSAISLVLSVRLGTMPTLIALLAVLIAGLVSDYAVGRFASNSIVALFLYRLIPNWQHFWVPEALVNDGRIPWRYVLDAAIYASAYSAATLCAGIALFRRAEMK